LASPPEIWDRHQIPPQVLEHSPEVRYNKTIFISSRDLSTPLPNAEQAYFAMEEMNYCYKEKEDEIPSDHYRAKKDVIRIAIKEEGENLTRVVGDIDYYFHRDLAEYMNQLKDQVVKKFPVVEYKNGEPKETAKGKVRGPNNTTIKSIEKIYIYRQDKWDGGFVEDMPYWTDVCEEVGISPKTAKKYAPNLHENFRDKNYRWDWSMEDIWWEDNSSKKA
jgi:hypothetical protein